MTRRVPLPALSAPDPLAKVEGRAGRSQGGVELVELTVADTGAWVELEQLLPGAGSVWAWCALSGTPVAVHSNEDWGSGRLEG